ncbi:hypothetical protein Tco_0610743 [Tanacetum coccineum]
MESRSANKAFTASENVLTIYIQQFWNILAQDAKTGEYNFQLDEQWFTLNVDLLRKALEITLVDSARPFKSPPADVESYSIIDQPVLDQRPGSPLHITGDDFLLEYYQQYLEMVARKPTVKEGENKKTTSKADKPKKTAPVKPSRPVKEKTSKPAPSTKIRKGKVMKVHKGNRSGYLGLESNEEPPPASEIPVKDDELTIREIWTPVTHDASTRPSTEPQDDTSANVVRNSSSPAEAKTGVDIEKANSEVDTKILNVGEEQGEDVSNAVALKERTVELDKGQDGSDPSKTPETRPPPEQELMEEDRSNPEQSHVALDGPNCEPIHKDSITTVYPKVYESLKLTAEEHVLIENPPRSHLEYSALYEALESSIDHENREEFLEEIAKSQKRRYDDQDPPLPLLKDSDQSKKKRHDSDASASQ